MPSGSEHDGHAGIRAGPVADAHTRDGDRDSGMRRWTSVSASTRAARSVGTTSRAKSMISRSSSSAAFEHQHVAATGEHLESRVGDELRDQPRLGGRREQVGGADDHQRRHLDLRKVVGEVETDQRAWCVEPGLGRALGEHLAHQLDVARTRVAPEAEPREQEPEVRRRPHPARVGGAVRDLLEPAFRARRVRPERGARERREQHDAGHALGRELGELRGERLHRDAAHRMADEHGVAQVERFEDGLQVDARGSRPSDPPVAEHRLPWPRWSYAIVRKPAPAASRAA